MLNKCLGAVLQQVDEVIITREEGAVLPEHALQHPKIQYVISPETNIGFGRNVNFGAQYASGDFLLILNDDVFLAPNAVSVLLRVMADSAVGLVGHLLRFPNGRIYHGGKHRLPGGAVGYYHIDLHKLTPTIVTLTEIENVCGASVLFRKKAFDAIEGFAPSFFMYSEDDDAALRLRQLGWKVMYDPLVEGVHLSQGEAKRFPHMNAIRKQSNKQFAQKWEWYFHLNNGKEGLGRFK